MIDRSWNREDFEALYAASPDPWIFTASLFEQR